MARCKKRFQYEKSMLSAAIRAVRMGKGISKAARMYNVPKTTLYDHTKGKYIGVTKKPGPERCLTNEEEAILIGYMEYMAKRGHPLTVSVLKLFVAGILRKRNRKCSVNVDAGPSNRWCRKFFNRHPELRRRRPDKADKGRLEVTREEIDNYFELLQKTVTHLGLENSPEQIYNCDETGFDGHELIREKVVIKKGQHPYQTQPLCNLGHVTVHMAVSAAGSHIPILLIFSKHKPRNLESAPRSWMYEVTNSGYINSDLFTKWMRDLFIPNCGKNRPILLIMDNLGSHLNPDVIDIAQENQIELLCLPAHSTHLLQPLDTSIFHKIKGNFSKSVSRLGLTTARLSREKFPLIINYAVSLIPPIEIQEAFRSTGIHPVDATVVIKNCKQQLKRATESEKTTTDNINPLVQLGIVPQDLVDILVPPPSPKKKSKRNIAGARVITAVSDRKRDVKMNTRNTEEPVPGTSRDTSHAKSATSCSSGTRCCKRRKTKATKKRGVSSKLKGNTSDQDTEIVSHPVSEIHLDDGICVVCMTNERKEWIGCDKCSSWQHYECLPYHVQLQVDLSLVEGSMWLCNQCTSAEE